MVSGAGIFSHLDSVYGAIGFNSDHNAFGSPNVPTKIRSNVTPIYSNGTNEYTILHSGNYSSYALPLSGGILQADSADLLVINRLSSTNTAYITFKGNNSLRGRLGFNADGLPVVQVPSVSSNNLFLIHSNNIGSYNAGSADVVAKTYGNQSINFANNESKLRLIKWEGGANSVDNGYPRTYMSGLSVMTDYTGWQMVTYGSIGTPNPYFRSFGDDGRRSEWKQLAFLTDNVASATKLQTARTIWGQNFDGTGNVSGVITMPANHQIQWVDSNAMIYGNGSNISISCSGKLNVMTTGNVLIGTTTDNGAKLQVNGNLTVTGEVISTRRATSSDARLKENINRLIAEDCLAMVRNLQPSSWNWKENGEHSMGFIAQDIEPLMPYAVTRTKDDKLGEKLNLQYDQFFAPVVGAIQCLDSEVEQLKKRVKYLENKLQEYGYNRY